MWRPGLSQSQGDRVLPPRWACYSRLPTMGKYRRCTSNGIRVQYLHEKPLDLRVCAFWPIVKVVHTCVVRVAGPGVK